MNLRSLHANPKFSRGRAAFTMIEIAIALAVIAFALVAIIGILPTGLQTNRENREETIVNQDARLLIEAIKSGGRDLTSDLGAYVISTNKVLAPANGIPTTNLIQFLCSDVGTNANYAVLSAISGAIVTRGSDLGFRYRVRINITTNRTDFNGAILSDQFYDVRLVFAWPVLPDNVSVNSEANTYAVRTSIAGWRTNDLFYAQQYYHPAP